MTSISSLRARLQHRGARLRQRGISLLELIAGLAIIAIIIIGALALVSQADTSAKSGDLLRGLAAIRAGTIAASSSEVGYGASGTVMNTSLLRSRRVPENWTVSGNFNQIRHRYGGDVTVTSLGTTFQIQLAAIPQEACIQLISQQSGTSWANVRVSGTTVTFPTTLALSTNACATATLHTLIFVTAS